MNSMDRRKMHKKRGFTLVELMIVISIIGVLSTVAVPSFLRASAKTQRTEMIQMMSMMRTHFISLYRNQGTYPATTSAFNPCTGSCSGLPVSVGTPLEWVPSAQGWSDFSAPPDGRLRMRYQYTSSGQTLALQAVGALPGIEGPYSYTETYAGEVQVGTAEFPDVF